MNERYALTPTYPTDTESDACGLAQDLTYGTSIVGSERIFRALASYYSTYFKPVTPIEPKHIATSNGLSPMIEHVAAVISDPEDAWLLPAWVPDFPPLLAGQFTDGFSR